VSQSGVGALFLLRFGEQALAEEGVVIRAVEGLLEAPVETQLRRGFALDCLELREGGIDSAVGSQRPRQLRSSESRVCAKGSGDRADEETAVVAKDVGDIRIGIPAEAAPDELVHIVIAAFGVRHEAFGVSDVAVKMAASSTGRGLMTSRASVVAKAKSQSGTGNSALMLWVMSG